MYSRRALTIKLLFQKQLEICAHLAPRQNLGGLNRFLKFTLRMLLIKVDIFMDTINVKLA